MSSKLDQSPVAACPVAEAACQEVPTLACQAAEGAFQVGSSLSLSKPTSTMGVWVRFKALTNRKGSAAGVRGPFNGGDELLSPDTPHYPQTLEALLLRHAELVERRMYVCADLLYMFMCLLMIARAQMRMDNRIANQRPAILSAEHHTT